MSRLILTNSNYLKSSEHSQDIAKPNGWVFHKVVGALFVRIAVDQPQLDVEAGPVVEADPADLVHVVDFHGHIVGRSGQYSDRVPEARIQCRGLRALAKSLALANNKTRVRWFVVFCVWKNPESRIKRRQQIAVPVRSASFQRSNQAKSGNNKRKK